MGAVPNATKSSNTQNNNHTAYIATPEAVNDESWCLDLGVSNHVTNDVNQLHQKNKFNGKTKLTIADGKCLPIHHMGTSVINSPNHK